MAACLKTFTAEQVLEQVLDYDSDSGDAEEFVKEEESVEGTKKEEHAQEVCDEVGKQLKSVAEQHDVLTGRVVESTLETLHTYIVFCSGAGSEVAFLNATPIHAGTVFMEEGGIWLEHIYRRLTGRRNVRRPFYAEIHRCIPHAIFNVLVRLVRQSDGFVSPFCQYAKDKKTEVMALVSVRLVGELFSILSGRSQAEVADFFKRKLTGKRGGHKVSIIVDNTRTFCFFYKLKKGELTIGYHFGEWNTCGFPLHNY